MHLPFGAASCWLKQKPPCPGWIGWQAAGAAFLMRGRLCLNWAAGTSGAGCHSVRARRFSRRRRDLSREHCAPAFIAGGWPLVQTPVEQGARLSDVAAPHHREHKHVLEHFSLRAAANAGVICGQRFANSSAARQMTGTRCPNLSSFPDRGQRNATSSSVHDASSALSRGIERDRAPGAVAGINEPAQSKAYQGILAERAGFEPARPFRVCSFSKRVPSASRPPLQRFSNRASGRPGQCFTPPDGQVLRVFSGPSGRTAPPGHPCPSRDPFSPAPRHRPRYRAPPPGGPASGRSSARDSGIA